MKLRDHPEHRTCTACGQTKHPLCFSRYASGEYNAWCGVCEEQGNRKSKAKGGWKGGGDRKSKEQA